MCVCVCESVCARECVCMCVSVCVYVWCYKSITSGGVLVLFDDDRFKA